MSYNPEAGGSDARQFDPTFVNTVRAIAGAPTVAEVLVSLPLAVNPPDDVTIATLELGAGLYLLACGAVVSSDADPGGDGALQIFVDAVPSVPQQEDISGHLLGADAPSAVGPIADSVIALSSHRSAPGDIFYFVSATVVTARAISTAPEVGGSLVALSLAALPLA